MNILAVTGGVGGAKLCLGLQQLLPPPHCKFIVNVGDDFEHLGLHISPDIDTLTYALAGLTNVETGWGRKEETWHFLSTLKELGGPAWFNLGDKDLALHVYRTELLKAGVTLSDVTRQVVTKLGIEHDIWPITNDRVPTTIEVPGEKLAFQEYFVRERCEPVVKGFSFEGADQAAINPIILQFVENNPVDGIVICPSNPYISIDPVLAVGEIRNIFKELDAPVIAISPIIAGQAIKGPTAKIMQELDIPNSATAVAAHYRDVLDGFVIDQSDAALVGEIEALGLKTIVAQTVMVTLDDKIELARTVYAFLRRLRGVN